MISLLLVLATILYLIMMVVLRYGMERADRVPVLTGFEPHVSVIVAARNEERSIETCIESLLRLEYPEEKLEFIIVNDGSTDRTDEIARRYSAVDSRVKVVTALPGSNNLRGKANAVSQGIEVSRGEILMFTDADCTVPETWARSTVQYFSDHVGIVGGFTILESGSAFRGMQALDWVFLFGIASAACGLNSPLTAIGNNLAVSRKAYDAVGGFRNIPFSVTEDYALVRAIISTTDYKISFPIDPGSAVRSLACGKIAQLFRQKQRWGVGGLDMVIQGIIIMSVGWILRILFIASIFVAAPVTLLLAGAAIVFADVRFLFRPLQKMGILRYFKYIVAFELYYMLYVPVLPIVALLSRTIVWKERSL